MSVSPLQSQPPSNNQLPTPHRSPSIESINQLSHHSKPSITSLHQLNNTTLKLESHSPVLLPTSSTSSSSTLHLSQPLPSRISHIPLPTASASRTSLLSQHSPPPPSLRSPSPVTEKVNDKQKGWEMWVADETLMDELGGRRLRQLPPSISNDFNQPVRPSFDDAHLNPLAHSPRTPSFPDTSMPHPKLPNLPHVPLSPNQSTEPNLSAPPSLTRPKHIEHRDSISDFHDPVGLSSSPRKLASIVASPLISRSSLRSKTGSIRKPLHGTNSFPDPILPPGVFSKL